MNKKGQSFDLGALIIIPIAILIFTLLISSLSAITCRDCNNALATCESERLSILEELNKINESYYDTFKKFEDYKQSCTFTNNTSIIEERKNTSISILIQKTLVIIFTFFIIFEIGLSLFRVEFRPSLEQYPRIHQLITNIDLFMEKFKWIRLFLFIIFISIILFLFIFG